METGKTNDKTKTLALSGLLCSATLLLTLLNVPLPSGYGYIHLGDAGVFLSVCLLTTPLGAAAAGVGSALADLILGYAMYAPATLIIKGLTALCVMLVLKKGKNLPRLLLAGCACLLIPLLYYVYEAIFFMGAGAIVNVPANALQAAVGAALGLTVGKLVEKALHNRSQT